VISSAAMRRRVCRVCVVHATPSVLVRLLAVGALGCGPITYVGEVSHRAADAVDAARAAQAEAYAPYWWTRATEYLHKAREIAAHADFQGADRFGRLAAEAADQAASDARLAAKDPSKRPRGLPPDVVPARATSAPSRDLPAAPATPAPAKEPRPARIAPAKDPP
jgi:hypothetical protein